MMIVRLHGSPGPRERCFLSTCPDPRLLPSGIPEQPGHWGARAQESGRRNVLQDGYSSASRTCGRLLYTAEKLDLELYP